MGESVHLQFTQEDRDMVRDTHNDVKQILLNQRDQSAELEIVKGRLSELEKWQQRVIAATSLITGTVIFIITKIWK